MSTTGLFRNQIFTQLPNPVYLRMIGYMTTLAVHLSTIVSMKARYQGDLLQDPDVDFFTKYQYRLLTVWNILAQCFYAGLGLSCDVLSLAREGKDSILLQTLKRPRDLFFSSLVFPMSMVIWTHFWALYLYEPTLILPPGVVKTLLPSENFLIHTFIFPVVIWEIICRPRKTPTSHLFNLAVSSLYVFVYTVVLVASYYETGKFMYPIFTMLYGTPYFFAFLGVCFISNVTFYKIQWHITEFLWGNKKMDTKKIN